MTSYNRLATAAAALTLLASAGAATAADFQTEQLIAPTATEAGSRWAGHYVGVFGGGGAGLWKDSWVSGGVPGSESFGTAGWLAGAVVGTDFTAGNGLILGLAADVAGSGISHTKSATPLHHVNVNWTASLRGRLGFDAGKFLPYVTGGLAVAGASASWQQSSSATHLGWTVGGGVEVAVNNAVSLDLQYRYSDFGSKTYNIGWIDYDARITDSRVTLGLNWKL